MSFFIELLEGTLKCVLAIVVILLVMKWVLIAFFLSGEMPRRKRPNREDRNHE